MPRRIEQLAEEIVRLQGELDREIEKRRADLGWKLNEGLIEFENGITQRHRQLAGASTMGGGHGRSQAQTSWLNVVFPALCE